MGDWQAIGQDPCTTGIDYDAISSEHMNATSNSSLYQQWLESCEALSNSSHQCFWNPKSRITGEFCNTCLRTCLSEQKSTNFYQFSLGVLLVSLTAPLCFVYIPAITSAITSVESQVYTHMHGMQKRLFLNIISFYFVCVCFWLGIYIFMVLSFPLFLFWCALNVNFHV